MAAKERIGRVVSNKMDKTVVVAVETRVQHKKYDKIIVARSNRSRFRAFGRNWNFEGLSAEVCKLDWHS